MIASGQRHIASGPPVRLAVVAAGAWLAALTLTACDRSPQTTSTPSPPPVAQVDPAAAQAALAAQTQAAQSWEPSALDDLLAPIALYPDALVGQILAASTNAQEVLDAGNWLLDNQDLKGTELDAATEKLGFGPAVRSLVHFPGVVDMMCSQLDWTREVGQAFTADQRGVLDSIQRLRSQAAAVGNLKSTPQQRVEKKEESGKQVIVVEPADPQVVYVPQYNPQVVYTTPPPAPATTTTVVQEGHDTGDMVAAGLIGFTAGIILNEAFDDHDDYYYPHWGGGPVYYPPPYRPVYPGYRPAGAYTRPVNYRHSYNNINGDVNINVGNEDYFNRVTHNQRAVNRKADTSEWRGQSSYRGSQAGGQDRSAGRAPVSAAQDRAPTNEYRRAADARGGEQRPRADATRGSSEYRGKQLNDQPVAGEYRGASRDSAERIAGGNTQRDGERLSTGAARGVEPGVERHVGGTDASTRQPRADRGFDSRAAAPSGAESVSRQGAAGSGALSNVSRGSREHAASQRGHQSAGNRARRSR
jgi:hypothetical protein